MAISLPDVRHIAHLARIALTEEQEEKFQKELSSILGFIEKLNSVDTEGVEPMTGGTSLENVMRSDDNMCLALEGESAALLDAAYDKKGGWVKVKSVFQ